MIRGGANLTRVNFALEADGIADMAAEPAEDEVRNVARALVEAITAIRSGRQITPGADLAAPRDK